MEDGSHDEVKDPDPAGSTPPANQEYDPFGPPSEQSIVGVSTKDGEQNPFFVKKEKGRVRFNSNAAATTPPPPRAPPARLDLSAASSSGSGAGLQLPSAAAARSPRPSVLRFNSSSSVTTVNTLRDDEEVESAEAMYAAAAAQERAEQVAANLRKEEARKKQQQQKQQGSQNQTQQQPQQQQQQLAAMNWSTNTLAGGDAYDYGAMIPLRNFNEAAYSGSSSSASSSRDRGGSSNQQMMPETETEYPEQEEAYNLVRAHTRRFGSKSPVRPKAQQQQQQQQQEGQQSQQQTQEEAPQGPELSRVNGGLYDGVYNVAAPPQYRGSVLSQLLKLYKTPDLSASTHHQRGRSRSSFGSYVGGSTPGSESGATTPTRRKWYDQNRSTDTLANLVAASAQLAGPGMKTPTVAAVAAAPDPKNTNNSGGAGSGSGSGSGNGEGPPRRPRPPRRPSGGNNRLSALWQREEVRITVHIAETLARQEYIIEFCRALMLYGAPTHRLEEYLGMTARVLEIDGQFLYLPGCMIISFDDRSTHTTEVRIVRTAQGIDLGKLKDVHRIYKEVMHDVCGVDEGSRRLDELMGARDKFSAWARVAAFGLTSAAAAPFSFGARLIDLPICFVLGCLVGLLQLIVAPMSNLYSNVLEVSATVAVSFLARAFGSINGGKLFCFSALAQGGIVMLLPGYLVLCSALELQSRAIVPGSIRIVYAIIYSLLLGFGITVGATLYGLVDPNASSATVCENPMPPYYAFAFVPVFDVAISILYQAKWRQMPVMTVIAFAGYLVNFFSTRKFAAAPQISNTLGALAVGVLANLYSRIQHGVAAATLIPAIFTQVPGGLASTGGLLSGLSTANLVTNSTGRVNGTTSVQFEQGQPVNTLVFNVAASMIQIAIGIAVGLFLSALLVYPLGKRRSGLFSF